MSKSHKPTDDAIARMASQLARVPKTRKERRVEINARYVERNPGVWYVSNNIIRPLVRGRAHLFGTARGGGAETTVEMFSGPKNPLLAEVLAAASLADKQALLETYEKAIAAGRSLYDLARSDFRRPSG
jgi:hypothetical protein